MSKDKKPLNSNQIRYARQRIEGLCAAKIADLPKIEHWRGDDTFKTEVKAGRYTLNKAALAEADENTNVSDVITLKRFPQGLDKHRDAQREAVDARRTAIRKEAGRIIDRLVLGDSVEALAAIEAFIAKKF